MRFLFSITFVRFFLFAGRSLLRRHMQALDARDVTFASPMKISLGCTLSFTSGEPDNAEKFPQLPYKLYGMPFFECFRIEGSLFTSFVELHV